MGILKKYVDVIFGTAFLLCAVVSLGAALFVRDISLTAIGVYLLGLAMLLGLQKLVLFHIGRAYRSIFVILLWTMTALQLPIRCTVPETLPLWQVVLLLAAVGIYLLHVRHIWEKGRDGFKLNALFTLFVIGLAYFASILTLMDGVWNFSADFAAISVVCYCIAFLKY